VVSNVAHPLKSDEQKYILCAKESEYKKGSRTGEQLLGMHAGCDTEVEMFIQLLYEMMSFICMLN